MISPTYKPICSARLTKVEQPVLVFMRFAAYGWSGPKCRNFASSSVLPGHPAVSEYRRVTEEATVSFRDFVRGPRSGERLT